jgi:hypothetical protein
MGDQSKKHHYVPQSVLRGFSSNQEQTRIYVFDKTKMRSFTSRIYDAGCENQFNTIKVDGQAISFEGLFQTNDDQLALLLNKIRSNRSLAPLTSQDRVVLSEVVAAQFIRTKMARTTIRSIAEHLQNTFPYGEVGLSAPGIEIYFPISSDLALGFFCPSMEIKIQQILSSEHPDIDRQKYGEINRGLQEGNSVSLGPGTVQFLNELQVHRSSRFLYSSTDKSNITYFGPPASDNHVSIYGNSQPDVARVFKFQCAIFSIPVAQDITFEKCLLLASTSSRYLLASALR